MRTQLIALPFVVGMLLVFAVPGSLASDAPPQALDKPLYKPFIERYILDELKSLRQDQTALRADVAEKVAQARLDAADRAIRYTADTTNTIFYIITATASILVLIGWKSLHDVRDKVERLTAEKLAELTQEYEQRLGDMETKLKVRSEQIMAAQEEIANTNLVHSLWMRAGLEKSALEKIALFDQILELNPDDIEALTYKADALLDIGEAQWALSLADQAIQHDSEYALAFWQRACARAELGQSSEAIADLEAAIRLSETWRNEISTETYFEKLRGVSAFDALLEQAADT
jgi:tetratricopeptide (TPR) repeat protein